jgi:hypothetical protein
MLKVCPRVEVAVTVYVVAARLETPPGVAM